jgi:O-antigen ligase
LIVLLAISDRGRYMLLEDKLLGRLVVCLAAGEWLILSGSRGGWAVTITGIVLVVLFSKQSRKPLLMAIAGLCFVTLLVLATGRGAKVNKVVDRTMNSNRSLANRTSGRSSQWEALPSIFAVSPIWGWGPGSGKDVDFIYTGRHLEFHSLYLQVIVETGVLGFVPLMCILGSLFNRAVAHLRRFGEVTPLVGIVSFLLIGLSVTAFDVLSGTILGLALMAREPNPRYVAREFAATPVDESELTTIDVGSS